jgi:hypothetical protein
MAQAQAGKPRARRRVRDVAEIALIEIEETGCEIDSFGAVLRHPVNANRIGEEQTRWQKVERETRAMGQHRGTSGDGSDPAIGVIAETRERWGQRCGLSGVGAAGKSSCLLQQRWGGCRGGDGRPQDRRCGETGHEAAPLHQTGASIKRLTKGAKQSGTATGASQIADGPADERSQAQRGPSPPQLLPTPGRRVGPDRDPISSRSHDPMQTARRRHRPVAA